MIIIYHLFIISLFALKECIAWFFMDAVLNWIYELVIICFNVLMLMLRDSVPLPCSQAHHNVPPPMRYLFFADSRVLLNQQCSALASQGGKDAWTPPFFPYHDSPCGLLSPPSFYTGAQDSMQGDYVISYTINREDEEPNWYWTIIETEKSAIHAEGESEEELQRDIIICAAVLGYCKDKITQHKA